ncbi:TolC family protein [Variovorax sp. J22R115]|uniref:TolC family protein n=1 Tax=Variovorax sp. J22R115 TaxID=3053509 RepID=UPI002576FA50|nr:TolC family protein [Variovorax sp. J22R115]MDM0051511.1 TolC family protein [Variovorax sp. J22R115]
MRTHSIRFWSTIALAALGAAGCALKSPPDRASLASEALPNAPAPAAWKAGAAPGSVGDDWIAGFGDPVLNQLVAEALAYNNDLRASAARVEQAAAGVKAAGAQIWPAIDVIGRRGGKMGGDGSGLNGWVISASWEIDLWGRVRYARRSAEDQYASTQADLAAARQSIAALVAKSWFLATEAALQRQLARQMIDTSNQSVKLADQRWRIGASSEVDVVQAQANLKTFVDAERQLDLAYSKSLRSLELLLGRYPGADVKPAASWPRIDMPVGAGVPSELLERRPDIVAAERRVAAAFDRTQEAQAARLPRVSLSAGISSITSEMFVLKDRDNPSASIGAGLIAPLFHGGALLAQVEARKAEQQQAVAAWAQTALKAFNEVETALAEEATLREREPILDAQARDAQKVLDIENSRYRIGSRDLRTVTQQEMSVYAARSTLLRVQAERRVQRVNLLLALGGGFGPGTEIESALQGQEKRP